MSYPTNSALVLIQPQVRSSAYFGESDHLIRGKRPVIGELATPEDS
jgi:hypothetical protein